MGMFDTVIVNCPRCGRELEFQSKSGPCVLERVNLEDCPEDILKDVNRHSPHKCECGGQVSVEIEAKKARVLSDKHKYPLVDDYETWDLSVTTARFLVPRLKRFRELSKDKLVRPQSFYDELEILLKAMELIAEDNVEYDEGEQAEEIQKGLNLFPKIFRNLWW